MLDVETIRTDFPILSREIYSRPLIYLDNGATAQKPLRVIERIDSLHRNLYGNIHRGVHYLSQECTTLYEQARERVRSFIGAASPQEVIFTSGATASINLVAYSLAQMGLARDSTSPIALSPGDNVVATQMEHHSNFVPWQIVCRMVGAELRMAPFDERGMLDMERLEAMIDGRTRLVAITQASNVLGTRPDLERIIAMAHRRGALVLVDGCQGVVHGGVDVAAMDCDFYAFSGHKLYGPTGTGALYGKRELLEQMPPFMGGGDMVESVSLEKTTWANLPLKFEVGTANFVGAIGLGEAIEWLAQFDPVEVATHEQMLLERATGGLTTIEGLTIYGHDLHKCPIVSFTVEGVHHYDIGMVLDKLGIAVRTGTHCAEPTMLGCRVEGMCRASMAIYNTAAEVDALVKGVALAVNMLRQ